MCKEVEPKMSELFNAYDNYLIGKERILGTYHFVGDSAGGVNEKTALSCIKYVIEYILQWNRDTAIKKFDSYIIHKLKLNRLLQYIDFPIDVEYGDPEYILSLLYPKNVHLSQTYLVEKLFQSILKKKTQFPREYFSGDMGMRRYCICLRYLIWNYHVFYTVEEIYQFFNSASGNSFLSKFRLKSPASQLGIDIMQAVYESTKDEPNSELYYCYYLFSNQVNIKKSGT